MNSHGRRARLRRVLLWARQDAPWKTGAEFVAAARAETLKMGGITVEGSRRDAGAHRRKRPPASRTTYIPFKSGGEAAVQMAGGHIDGNTNNPAENVGQWKAGQGRPICVFSATRLAPVRR